MEAKAVSWFNPEHHCVLKYPGTWKTPCVSLALCLQAGHSATSKGDKKLAEAVGGRHLDRGVVRDLCDVTKVCLPLTRLLSLMYFVVEE